MSQLKSNKRKAFDIEEKLQIIKDFEENKLTVSQLIIKYQRPQSSISSIINKKQKDKILEKYQENLIQPEQKRIRDSNFTKLEEALNHWFQNVMSNKNITLNGPLIQAQAIKYATMLQCLDFKASNGWLDGFKKIHNISFKTVVGEAGLVDTKVIEDWFKILPDLIKGYDWSEIFNADETALFFKALPNKTLYFSGVPCNSIKQIKERLSLLLAANWSGSEKLMPLVIGKSKNPRCFKQINKTNLHVLYRNNNKAWMNAVIFKEWLIKLDKKFKNENRKIIMFLDNFSGHHDTKSTETLHLTNIKLAFFPPNCTSVCQPMDQGIIQSFKINYRRFLIEEKIFHIEQGSEMPEINVYSAINMINKAWIDSVSTIQNCFKKGGFIKQYSEDIVISEPDDMSEYSKSYKTLCTLQNSAFDFNQYAYVNIDKDLACCETVTDEEIIQMVNRNDLDEASSDEDEEEVQTTRSPIKNAEALIIIDKLRHYVQARKMI